METLDPGTLAALDEGIRSEQTGRLFTWEEVKANVQDNRMPLGPKGLQASAS